MIDHKSQSCMDWGIEEEEGLLYVSQFSGGERTLLKGYNLQGECVHLYLGTGKTLSPKLILVHCTDDSIIRYRIDETIPLSMIAGISQITPGLLDPNLVELIAGDPRFSHLKAFAIGYLNVLGSPTLEDFGPPSP